jgi:hypothetical protein
LQCTKTQFVPSIFHSFSSVGALQVVGCKMKPYVTIRQLISDLVMWKDISQEFNFRYCNFSSKSLIYFSKSCCFFFSQFFMVFLNFKGDLMICVVWFLGCLKKIDLN